MQAGRLRGVGKWLFLLSVFFLQRVRQSEAAWHGIGAATISVDPRKRGRVVDCTGLENRQRATVREFESHRFRQIQA